ncbi:MAG: methionine biosynthesis protein MetW [Candidatus Omnitrophota bacterium]
MLKLPLDARLDHRVIFECVEPGAKVLDLGCGAGELLALLKEHKGAKVQGIEISEEAIYRCVEKGLSVVHSDIDSGLPDYPNGSFDIVILNQSLQESKRIDWVLREALRVGKKVIIGFPNFAYLPSRAMLFFRGQAPITKSLPYRWYNSPNLHFLSITDFRHYCRENNIRILEAHYLGQRRRLRWLSNLLAMNAVFVLAR